MEPRMNGGDAVCSSIYGIRLQRERFCIFTSQCFHARFRGPSKKANVHLSLVLLLQNDLVVSAVLSGNRNFEGRVHPLTRANYLASPPLVVAYALAGRVDIDFDKEPIGECSATFAESFYSRINALLRHHKTTKCFEYFQATTTRNNHETFGQRARKWTKSSKKTWCENFSSMSTIISRKEARNGNRWTPNRVLCTIGI